jgi:hypothetical protein
MEESSSTFLFLNTEAQLFDDVAILYSLWETKTEVPWQRLASSGRATEIFIHRNGRWLKAGWHLDSGNKVRKELTSASCRYV